MTAGESEDEQKARGESSVLDVPLDRYNKKYIYIYIFCTFTGKLENYCMSKLMTKVPKLTIKKNIFGK